MAGGPSMGQVHLRYPIRATITKDLNWRCVIFIMNIYKLYKKIIFDEYEVLGDL